MYNSVLPEAGKPIWLYTEANRILMLLGQTGLAQCLIVLSLYFDSKINFVCLFSQAPAPEDIYLMTTDPAKAPEKV